ncbi:hypothetical protein FA95DRAFT_1566594, partial [Auriscalpium vulgare]
MSQQVNERRHTSCLQQGCFTPVTRPLSHPAPSLLLSKPFRCTRSNCKKKSYKLASGLKDHRTHGSVRL